MRYTKVTVGGNKEMWVPVDSQGLAEGWPWRSGALQIINGAKLAIKYWMIEVAFTYPAAAPSTYSIALNNTIQGFLLTSFYWSIEAYSVATLPKVPSGNTVIPQATLSSAYISLYDNNALQFWNQKPLRDLQTINDTASKAGKSYPDSLGGMRINWQNSQIFLADCSGLAGGTTYSLPLGLAFTFNANYQTDGIGSNTYNTQDINN